MLPVAMPIPRLPAALSAVLRDSRGFIGSSFSSRLDQQFWPSPGSSFRDDLPGLSKSIMKFWGLQYARCRHCSLRELGGINRCYTRRFPVMVPATHCRNRRVLHPPSFEGVKTAGRWKRTIDTFRESVTKYPKRAKAGGIWYSGAQTPRSRYPAQRRRLVDMVPQETGLDEINSPAFFSP